MAIGDTLKSAARTQIDKVSNAITSKVKVPSTKKDQKKAVANPNPEELVRNEDVFLTEGFAKHPIIETPETKGADFYRKGNAVANDADEPALNVQTYMQRFVDEFDEEEASIRVLGPPKGNAKTGERQDLIPPFTKFLLENVQESHSERSQVVETFGTFYAFFFGERPPVYNFSGTLVNSRSINWLSDFMFYYENFLRGTRCVENNASLVLTYGGRQIEGFLLNVSSNTQAINDKGVAFSFQVLVIDRKILSLSVDFGLVLQNGKFAQDDAFLRKLAEVGLSRAEVSRAFNTVKQVSDLETPAADGKKAAASSAKSIEDEFKIKVAQTVTGGLKKLIG